MIGARNISANINRANGFLRLEPEILYNMVQCKFAKEAEPWLLYA